MRTSLFSFTLALALTTTAPAKAQNYPSDVKAQLQVAANDWLRAYSGYFSASANGYNDNIRAKNDGVRAYSQLVEANADYQLLRSQALLFRAEAEVQLAKARRLNLDNFFWYQQIHVFYAEKYQYLKDVHRIRKQAEYLRSDLALASNLRNGELTQKNIEAFQRCFRSLTMRLRKRFGARLQLSRRLISGFSVISRRPSSYLVFLGEIFGRC